MRKRALLVLAGLALGFTLGMGTAVLSAERHPQIHAAMRALRNAANHLQRAAHVFGGHRAKALELVRSAQNELQQALAYADTHPRK